MPTQRGDSGQVHSLAKEPISADRYVAKIGSVLQMVRNARNNDPPLEQQVTLH